MSLSTVISTEREARPSGHATPWRLSRRSRRITLVAHIFAAGAWIGIDVVVAVLVLTGWFSDDMRGRALAYQALATFVVWPMLTAGLVTLATGLILGLGSKWGLFRYWWVAVKIAVNLILCTMIVLVLQPGVGEVGEYGRDLLTGNPDSRNVSTLFFPPAVSLTTLALATTLGVAKPWGRISKRNGSQGRGPVAPRLSCRYLAASGLFLLVAGLVGFTLDLSFPTSSADVAHSHGHIFGVLETNGWHNLAAVGIGLPSVLIAMWRPNLTSATCLVTGVMNGAVFCAFAFWGPETFLVASNSGDQVLHAVLAVGGMGVGIVGLAHERRSALTRR